MIVPAALFLLIVGASPAGPVSYGSLALARPSSGVYLVGLDGRLVDLTRGASIRFSTIDSSPGFVFSPDGRSVAFLCDGASGGFTTVCAVGLNGRGLVELTPRFAGETFPFYQLQFAWSPDSRELAASWASTMSTPVQARTPGVSGELYVAGLRSGARRIVQGDILNGSGAGPAWSPDGRLIAFTLLSVAARLAPGEPRAQDGEVHVVAPSGAPAWQATGWAPAWSPQGDLAVVLRVQQIVRIYDAEGQLIRSVKVPGAQGVEWLSNARLRVDTTDSALSTVIDTLTGQSSSLRTGRRFRVIPAEHRCGPASICLGGAGPTAPPGLAPVISPDGSLRATVPSSGAVRVAAINGNHPRTLVQLPECRAGYGDGYSLPPTDLRFTPDGRALIFLAGDC